VSEVIQNRYDFVVFFDVENGNPNGDPDAGNMPRIDAETGYGLVTDVCLKRKIRNYVETLKEGEPGFDIYIKEKIPLNTSDKRALRHIGIETDDDSTADTDKKDKKAKTADQIKLKKKEDPNIDIKIRDFMCQTFYDIRTFGAVMTTFVKNKLNCGQVRGPVQISFGRSVDPIVTQELTITRVAITTESDAEEKGTEMGRKYIIPYALYRAEGFVSANLARKTTGFSEDDLELLWQAIMNMFENDRSAARGKMAVRKLVIFKHDSELGNAPAHMLFDRISAKLIDDRKPPRAFSDYEIEMDVTELPEGVSCEMKL
jgi:CRISPR-associated protein Csd2